MIAQSKVGPLQQESNSMTQKYQQLAFTDAVRKKQEANGSAAAYASSQGENLEPDILGNPEITFIQSRDSFYMATVNSSGWPYIQHRGGPAGFLKALSGSRLIMPDFRGNRQYVTLGNMAEHDKASLFFMDYPRQARLKLLTTVKSVDLSDDEELAQLLQSNGYKAKIDRAFEFAVIAYDWNCPQHITPRYTEADIKTVTDRFTKRIAELEMELNRLKD